MKYILLALSLVALSATAEPLRVSVFTPEGELFFLGIYEASFKPALKYDKPYACTIVEEFKPKIVCTLAPKGKADKVGRYCIKKDKKSDLMCSKSIMVGV